MKVFPSSYFAQKSKKFFKKRPELKNKVQQKLKLLEIAPNHPSLGLHKLKGDLRECWAVTIEKNLRVSFTYIPEGILLITIGSHDEVY
ncbi:MAG: type II toxin-antitoxin system RelE/ParE family toxin [Patescibacteria group bacterium]|nr:type II toxin-antitoxin system RelE/ParE family toxin [Patescibacteria group bacterium]MCL5432452.1 type II toxin-antitoxin system RelE/ParE family toxin [Patescibacteria group bacterium]